MKRVIIDVDKDSYCVSSKDNDGKQLDFRSVIAITLVASIDKMISAGYDEDLIMDIVKQTYDQRMND